MSRNVTDYDKMSPIEHVLARPDTYIGDIEPTTEEHWVLNLDENVDNKSLVFTVEKKKINFVPGLLKIFDEIIVNSRDHSINDKTCDTIKVSINIEENTISVFNNGNNGIPVAEHPKFKTLVPTMIFGEMLTSSNYNDTEKRTTGGRNGYGAKLTSIFSTEFTVEIGDPHNKKYFEQTWKNNMNEVGKQIIKKYNNKNGYTKITFKPDLKRFGIKDLSEHYNLFAKRCFDIAGCSNKTLKVYFNDKKIEVNDFKKYVDCYFPNTEIFIDDKTDRWEVGIVFAPEKGDIYISNVNGIHTYLGGTHVNHVVDQIINKIRDDYIKKKNKDLKIAPTNIKQHLVFIINAIIENPQFSSQTKSTLTTKTNKFGSTYSINDTFMKKLAKSGIVEQVVQFATIKEKMNLSKNDGKKQVKLRGIPKLEDATKAGTKDSSKCALILTEGDSAKTFAMSGLGVIGNEYFGVFPLKGKLLNVREAGLKQLQGNEEINNLIKIIGLKYNEDYSDDEKFKQLRYGKIISLCDQDVDGSHIKGLLINMFHSLWPSLVKREGFITSLATPIVKAFKNNEELVFYNLSDYENWLKMIQDNNDKNWKIKYYKGLGTSTSNEAKVYFQEIETKLIRYFWQDVKDEVSRHPDDDAITLAFDKTRADDRKVWLSNYDKDNIIKNEVKQVHYNDFVNKELIHFSNDDLSRSIPSIMDGLKPSQRKILYGAYLRGLDKTEVKVAQLAGFVSDRAEYHHGEMSLQQAIIGMAQNFVGSNNINLLRPNGGFGTILKGGKDAASARYIWTELESLTQLIFKKEDLAILEKQYEDGNEIEPVYYAPIIPMVLVNGATGIGTGYSTNIPCYNPIDIIENLKNIINGNKVKSLVPWYAGFKGDIRKVDKNNFEIRGKYSIKGDKLIIEALPIGYWSSKFKEDIEAKFEKDSEVKGKKKENYLVDYVYKSDDKKVYVEIIFKKDYLKDKTEDDIASYFGLIKKLSTTNMHLYSPQYNITKYKSIKDIFNVFYQERYKLYQERKKHQLEDLLKQLTKINNKVRFILMKLDNKIKIENKKKKDLETELEELKFDRLEINNNNYDYLLTMPMLNLTFEKVEELKKERLDREVEYNNLLKKTENEIWLEELELLKTKYIKFYEDYLKDLEGDINNKSVKTVKKKKI
jgi:DNA topoisomerase II